MDKFHEAWWYLNECSIFDDTRFLPEFGDNYFANSLEIDVVKVNPLNSTIEDDESLNTKTEVWLECGEPYFDKELETILYYHTIEYDTGGDTFEEAIINLAEIIKLKIKEKDNKNNTNPS